MVQEGGSALRRIGAYSALFGALAYLILAPAPAHAAASGPRDLEAPEVETAGRPEIGENLTCYPGSWEGSGVTFTYEWQREGAPLASGQTHQITAADEGHWLSCVVRATDGEGATEASSKDSFFINPPDKGPPKGGTISGRVTDAASATAISGVKACAENTNSTGPWVCVHTSTNGQYTMTVAEAGNYIVQFTVPPKSAYIASTYYNGAYASSEATVLPIAAGTTTTGIDAQLQEGGRITGIVTSASTGAPVQAVEVCARAAPGECALTNARGDYSISGLATGSYNVEFGFGYGGSLGETYVAPEYYKGLLFPSFLSSEATPVAVTAGATVEAINAEMHEWGKLSGRVTSASTHMPIPGIEVSAYNGSRTRTVTNANGEYLISHLGSRSGEYQVAFWPYSGVGLNYFPQWYSGKEKELESNPVHVPLDRTTSDIDAELIEGGQITGRVTNAATKAPVDEIAVCARSKTLYEGRCASTGTNGEYAITGLPSDEYEVSFYTNSETYFPQYYNGKSSVFEGQKVAVTAGHGTSGVDAELEKVEDGVIMGNVADKLSIAAIKGIEVCAYELGSDEAFAEELSADCATTNANGEYRITGLTGSQYLIEFYSPAGSGLNYATQFYSERASPLRAEVVRVTQGEYTPGINGRLELAGKLAGKVTAAGSGQPIKGIEVCVFTRGEELVGCLLSNAGGEYLTPPVARGEYKVEFVSPLNSGLNFVPEFYDGSSDWNNAQVVTVAAEATSSDVNAELQEGGRISGQVTNAWTSAPIKGAEVCAISESKEISGCAITGATGGYTIAGLPNGGYRVAFGAGKGYIVQYYNDATSLSGAQTVSVTVGGTHEGIDAALEPSSATLPSNTSLPIVTGSPAVGDVLSCSSGSWTGSPTPTFSYAWLRNGELITEPSAEATYTVQKADEGKNIECEVIAQNIAGTRSAFSVGVYVQPVLVGPSPAPVGTVPVPVPVPSGGGSGSGGSSATASGGGQSPGGSGSAGAGVLGDTESSASAAQIATLFGQELAPGGKAAKIAALIKTGGFIVTFKALEAGTAVIDWYQIPPGGKPAKKSKAKPILVASGRTTFSAAGTATIRVRLTPAGRRLLKNGGAPKLTAKGTFTPVGETAVTTTRTFVLKH